MVPSCTKRSRPNATLNIPEWLVESMQDEGAVRNSGRRRAPAATTRRVSMAGGAGPPSAGFPYPWNLPYNIDLAPPRWRMRIWERF